MKKKNKYETFQRSVMTRFMDEKQMANFIQEYQDNRILGRYERKVTDMDLIILNDYKNGKKLVGELMTKYKKSRAQIQTSLRLAALSKLK